MRVLLNALRPAVGGNAVLATELARELACQSGVVLSVLTTPEEADRWRAVVPRCDVVVRRTLGGPLRIVSERRVLRAAVEEMRPEIVHDPVSLLPFLRLPVKSVVSIADLNFEELSLGLARTSYKRALYGHAVRHADLLLCISEFTRATLCRFYPEARDKSRVVWCGHRYASEPIPSDDDGAGERFLLVFAHRPHKNAEAAVRILRSLRERWPSFRLKVVGADPRQREALLHVSKGLGIDAAIDMLCEVDDAALRDLYRRAVCLVFLSRYEGFGLPALEAMAAGCPVVASNRGALPEVVGDHAPVFDCEDWPSAAGYVARLCSEPGLRKQVREAGRAYAAQWTWLRAAQDTVRAYRAVLNGDGRSFATAETAQELRSAYG